MKLHSTLAIAALLIAMNAMGQRYSEHKWAKAKPNIELDMARFSGDDAVLIYQYQTIQNNVASLYHGELQVRSTVMRRIKLLTKKGIEDHSVIHVNKRRSDKLEVLDARTIKADGKVVDVSAKDMRRLDLESGSFVDDRYEQLRFAVPAAEVGDEIEMVYTLQSSGIRVGDDLYFHEDLPVLRSVIVLDMEEIFQAEVRPMNGAGDATVSKAEGRISYRWELRDLPGLSGERFGILTNEFPYISFVVRRIVITTQNGTSSYPVAPNSLANLYDQYVARYGLEGLLDQSGYRLATELKESAPGAGKLELAQAAVRTMADRLRIEDLPSDEVQQPLRHHLAAGRIDMWNLERLWWATLSALDLKPWVAFARNRYHGPMNAEYISPHLVTATFFAFNDDQGRMHFVFPSSTRASYALGELPWHLEGSNVLLARKHSFQDLVAETKQVAINRSPETVNATSETVSAEYDLSSGRCTSRHRLQFLGAVARKHQSELPDIIQEGRLATELFEDQEAVVLDSIDFHLTNDGAPKSAALRFRASRPIQATELDAGVQSIPLNRLLSAWTYGTFTAERKTGIDLPYALSDDRIARIAFNQPVQVLNADEVSGSTTNPYGACTMKVAQVDSRTIELRWSYTIRSQQIPVTGTTDLNGLHERSETVRNSDLIFKLL